MKIIIIGGYGTIGKKVAEYFSSKYETIIAGRTKGNYRVDLADETSIKNLFEILGKVDAIINIAGEVKWMAFEKMSEEDFYVGIRNKLMGQVNLVRIGKDYLNPKGSITLTTGILADDPVHGTTGAALVNGGIHGFVNAVKDELENGIRINVVSPGLVEDSVEKIGHLFPGRKVIPMADVVNGYRRSVEDNKTGEVIRIY